MSEDKRKNNRWTNYVKENYPTVKAMPGMMTSNKNKKGEPIPDTKKIMATLSSSYRIKYPGAGKNEYAGIGGLFR